MDNEDEASPEVFTSDTLVQGLRCPVCLEYFTKPHTLTCGHTFCLRCLKTIVRLVRRTKERVSISRLKFRCPTCRMLNNADVILCRRAAVNFALAMMMEEWARSPYILGCIKTLKLRSTAVQTDTTRSSSKTCPPNGEEIAPKLENSSTSISKDEFRQTLSHHPRPTTEEFSLCRRSCKPAEESSIEDISFAADTSLSNSEEASSEDMTSESDVPDEPDVPDVVDQPPVWPLQRPRLLPVLRMFCRDCHLIFQGIRSSRSRLLLTFIWCVYGIMVVALSRGFLPWICIYTVVFFIVLYVELVQPLAYEV